MVPVPDEVAAALPTANELMEKLDDEAEDEATELDEADDELAGVVDDEGAADDELDGGGAT